MQPTDDGTELEQDSQPQGNPDTGDEQGDALQHAVSRYRELVSSQTDLVAGMVRGDTIAEIDASAQQAREEYRSISRRVLESLEAQVPVGNAARSAGQEAASALRPEAKIAAGLKRS